MYSEQAGHGTSVYAAWGIPMVPGHEPALARFTPDGGLELRIGAHSHGQGLETTLSQVAHSILGVPHERIRLVHGDTAETPYSTGTWGSRCMIMAGGAVAAACDELANRVLGIGAKLLQAKREEVRLVDGEVVGPSGRIAVADVARTWYRRPQDLPRDVDPGGLEVTAGYKAKRDTGTFSYAAHAAVVAVDPETGELEILDYVVVEDGGVLVNPMIVDGQIVGGTAQGIGTALYEEMRFDAQGQPLASTLSDYLLPGADRGARRAHRAHGDALALHPLRPEGAGRRRRHRAPGRHHQRRQRRAGGAGRRAAGVADHAAAHRRGDRARTREGGCSSVTARETRLVCCAQEPKCSQRRTGGSLLDSP